MNKILCDICKQNEANKKFKVKMSRRGCYERTGYGGRWNDSIWKPYKRLDICEKCGEKLLGIASNSTIVHSIIESINKATKKKTD